jgi:hypothetical protein
VGPAGLPVPEAMVGEGGPGMTEREFLRLNRELHRRQERTREARKRSEPVHIRQVLPGVMDKILHRSEQQRREICG